MAPEYYIFTGGVVPDHVTHVIIAEALKFVRKRAFYQHPNIQEVICYDGVEKIERDAFWQCPSLRRVIMPGVKEILASAFFQCRALTHIKCGKLEIIGAFAFGGCTSLSSIDLPSIKVVVGSAFTCCKNLRNAKLGKDLESVGGGVFYNCRSLQRITIPLKEDMIAFDNTFQRCAKLDRVDLVKGVHETVSALLLEEWKNDINDKIDTINQILPNTSAGDQPSARGKAQAIRTWITSVLHKIVHYKAQHRRCLNEAAATLQTALPNDILFKNVLPFLELPSHTFAGED